MRAFHYVAFAVVVALSGCVMPVKIDRQFTVAGTTVSDGQITISLSKEVADEKEKLRFIQEYDMQKHIISRAGDMLAGRKVRRSLKIDFEITSFLTRTHTFMRGHTYVVGTVKLSENGKELESFKINVTEVVPSSGDERFNTIADKIAHQIHWYGAKKYSES